jgi:hypothetical protein
MPEKKEPKTVPFRIVSQAQVPAMRSRNQAFFVTLDAAIRTLPRGKSIILEEDEMKQRGGPKNVESVRHHVLAAQEVGRLPKQVQVIGRATANGHVCYVLMPEERPKHD